MRPRSRSARRSGSHGGGGAPVEPRIATVGHSNRPLEEFLAILRAHGVERIADVRRYPASRRWPHFSASGLAESLPAAGIEYAPMPGLGGRRRANPDSRHTAWRVEAFRGYADFMDTPEFRSDLTALEALARGRFTAVMCAEALPWRCHRSLVADALIARGWEVSEILCVREARRRELPDFARLDGDSVIYDGGQGKLL